MSSPFYDPAFELKPIVERYQRDNDVAALLDQLRALARRTPPEQLKAAARPFQDMPEVIIPLYERIVEDPEADAQSMVVLANAYWLAGRGPQAVDALASRARALDPSNRGAWHLWALSESRLRARVERWLAVTGHFPADQLARAALADNATSLAAEESDPVALKLAIATYESLLAEATAVSQRLALEQSLKTLRAMRV